MRKKSFFKRALYVVEFILLYPFYFILSILPISASSYICGKLLRLLGRFIKANKIAKQNIKLCFPEFSQKKINKIATDMWENLGRIFGELPHLNKLSEKQFLKRVKLKGYNINSNFNGVVVSAHFGNWEFFHKWMEVLGVKSYMMYRKVNNPYIERLIKNSRTNASVTLIPKGASSLKTIIKAIKKKENLGVLLDQRTNSGEEVKFFGEKVLAPTAILELCKKYDFPLHIMFVKRTKGVNFVLELSETLDMKNISVPEAIQKIYAYYERWIKKNPDQYFWVHNRFKKHYSQQT